MEVSKTEMSSPLELQVIGCGLGRTGTRSMKDALEILGFGPCHHMYNVFADKTWKRMDMFREAYAGKPVDWHAVMAGFGSTVDHPTTDFALELMVAFPDAKLILTTRDNADAWWKSFSATAYQGMRWHTRLITHSIPFSWRYADITKGMAKWYRTHYGVIGPDAYDLHKQRMVRLIPKERLLVFNVKEGWEPLCKFLDVPIPDVPFPRRNDTAALAAKIRKANMIGLGAWVVEFCVMGLLLHQVMQIRLWEMFAVGKMLTLTN